MQRLAYADHMHWAADSPGSDRLYVPLPKAAGAAKAAKRNYTCNDRYGSDDQSCDLQRERFMRFVNKMKALTNPALIEEEEALLEERHVATDDIAYPVVPFKLVEVLETVQVG